MVDEMPLSEAAQILGVTPRQAQRLAASGELGHTRRVGRTVVVTPAAVYRAHNNGTTSRGRPALPATAWTALDLLSGREAQGQFERRLADRLSTMSPIELARFARRRATITQLRVISRSAQRDLPENLIAAGLKPTGMMSPLITDWGLAGGRTEDVIDGYLYVGPDRTLRELGLREESGGRIALRILDAPVEPLPPAVVALDLMESMDSRARSVGHDRLTEMIDGLR
ncbi:MULTISPECIES: helix-turn-helix domain-containing protein [unclassified Mycobacterium]|uniref:helix-turn-helix domain-containing protein n=1 Tax=unclassified Mycobacterium TaxID=2642494 RepID=UPI0004198CB5|nr:MULTISPECIES: helix-turn-helix domain-containing protein [unclassified Mycobacterium]